MYHISVTLYVQHGIWISQILLSWIVTNCHIALDFPTGGWMVMSIIVNTFCAGTNKITGQNRMWCALRKNLSGFLIDSHGFQDLLSYTGLGKCRSAVWGTFSGLLTCFLYVCFFAFIVVIVLVLCLLSGALIASIEMFLHDRNGQKDLLLQLNMKITRPCAAVKREGLCFSLSGSTPHNWEKDHLQWKTQIGNGLTVDKLGLWREVISNPPRIPTDNLEFPTCRNSEQYLEQASQRAYQ